MRQDLKRCASRLSELKVTKTGWRETLDFGRAISDSGECVTEECAFGICQCQSGSVVSVST
jgi:hypothetical protein